MGYSHITTNSSVVSDVIEILNDYKLDYQVVHIGGDQRMLVTKSFVYLESGFISNDCDGHTSFKSKKFNRLSLFNKPIKWVVLSGDVEKIIINTENYNDYINPNSRLDKKACKFFQQGKCKYGNDCNFSHT